MPKAAPGQSAHRTGMTAMQNATNSSDWPMVTVVLPILNEAPFIERCVGSLTGGDYPRDRLEILVVDGMSTDGTREIVARLAAQDDRIRLLDNPRRYQACAMNIGIRAARGEIITRVDGHAEVAPDFLRNSVRVLKDHPECWCVGGAIETVSDTFVGRTIAAAMSTPVGVGNAMFRLAGYEGYVDTVAFGSHWKWIFDKTGLFDEEMVRNEDDEFSARMLRSGGRIFMSQSIHSRYFPRSSLRRLWRQYFQYGFWRIRTIQKARKPATFRQIVPLLFVTGFLVLLGAAVCWPPARWAFGAYAGLYACGLLAGAAQVARRVGAAGFVLAPVVFAILHFAYGLGSLKGIWSFVILRRGAGARESALTR